MHVQLSRVSKHYGPQAVVADVTLAVTSASRLGVVGPNGVGKSTLLRLLAGLETPDTGTVACEPPSLTRGYLPQAPDVRSGETLLGYFARRTGVADAERMLSAFGEALTRGEDASDAYAAALERLLALGGGDLEGRARTVCAELGLETGLHRAVTGLSGGELARLALAAVLLSRFDVLLLDEPTNDLDFDGLDRLEAFVASRGGALVVVSHDRVFLDRTVSRIAEIEPGSHHVREWAGTYSAYEAARDAARAAAYDRFAEARERRRHMSALLARRRGEARAGRRLTHRRGTHALETKVGQARRALERADRPEKPFEPWELRLRLDAGRPPGDRVVSLRGAVAERGSFRLGPVDLELYPGERVSVTGRNGSGKTTLLGLLVGDLPLATGTRTAGPSTVVGTIDQRRSSYDGDRPLLAEFRERTGLPAEEARTLLAKFGLRAGHVERSGVSLSPGERTRAYLAELQARRVNLLVLDEPTNHLDLEAIEQLEHALDGYAGTLVVVSHDRRFLERVAPTRRVVL